MQSSLKQENLKESPVNFTFLGPLFHSFKGDEASL
jgi:hypothetical protein